MKGSSIARRLGVAVAALAGVLAFAQPDLALARGGGGSHGGGGGFHGGGFHSGGFSGGFHGRGFRRHGFFGGGFDDGFDYPDYGAYGYSQPYASQYWYYCQNPGGYYPYVAQCSAAWQLVPAG